MLRVLVLCLLSYSLMVGPSTAIVLRSKVEKPLASPPRLGQKYDPMTNSDIPRLTKRLHSRADWVIEREISSSCEKQHPRVRGTEYSLVNPLVNTLNSLEESIRQSEIDVCVAEAQLEQTQKTLGCKATCGEYQTNQWYECYLQCMLGYYPREYEPGPAL